ncbi:MAG: zinc-binding dehydrogenase [Candidatus Bathyarchaeia archaeon]
MRAAMLYGIRDLRIEDVEIPRVEAGEVLVRVRAATTCGTDLKIFQRGYVERVIKLPTVFGHEWAGDVVEVGEGLEWPKKGMRVRAGNSAPCLRCFMCQKGKYNLCENMIWLWGAYAEYIKVPAHMVRVNMQEIPPQVSYEEAAIAEPLACVLHGIEEVGVGLGDSIVIIGSGPIGLLHLLTAKKMGAEKVVMVDLVENRLDFARKLGADETINATKENVEKKVKQLTGGYGADIVIEAIGQPGTWEQALKLARKGGKVLEFGGCPPGTEIHVSTELLHYGEVTIVGTFHATPLHFRKALNLIASKTINVASLITRKMSLEKIREAFEILATSKNEVKIAIEP